MGGKEEGDRDDRVSADLPFPRAPTFHSVGVAGVKRGEERRERRCKRSDRIYPDEERSGRHNPPFRPYFSFPPHFRCLRNTSESKRGFKLSNSLFISRCTGIRRIHGGW